MYLLQSTKYIYIQGAMPLSRFHSPVPGSPRAMVPPFPIIDWRPRIEGQTHRSAVWSGGSMGNAGSYM